MFVLFRHLAGSRPHPRRFAGAALPLALLACAAVMAGSLSFIPAAPALAQVAPSCTGSADGTVVCPNTTPPPVGNSSSAQNCYPGENGFSCTTYNGGGPPTVSNCIGGDNGWSCTYSTAGATSVSNRLTGGGGYSCSISTPGVASQATSCLTSDAYYTCTNYAGGAPASVSNCLIGGDGSYSCTAAPTGAYQAATTSSVGQYCTDASGGQEWVAAGAPTTGLTCGAGSGS